MKKKILYLDMDNVLVDFQSGIDQLESSVLSEYVNRLDEVPGIFGKMIPLKDAVESFNELSIKYDTYILSTAPWRNTSAWSDKLNWVKKYLGNNAYKRLILTHHKNLNTGDYLVDDRTKNGAGEFTGELILFGSDEFPNWITVRNYLLEKIMCF
jgi:5'-nucleotidase